MLLLSEQINCLSLPFCYNTFVLVWKYLHTFIIGYSMTVYLQQQLNMTTRKQVTKNFQQDCPLIEEKSVLYFSVPSLRLL